MSFLREPGDLARTPLAAILLEAWNLRVSGELTIHQAGGDSRLFFRDGMPVGAQTFAGFHPLGQILLGRGLIDIETLGRSLAEMARTRRRQGDVLVEMGAVSQEVVDRALEDQQAGYVSLIAGLSDGGLPVRSRRAGAGLGRTRAGDADAGGGRRAGHAAGRAPLRGGAGARRRARRARRTSTATSRSSSPGPVRRRRSCAASRPPPPPRRSWRPPGFPWRRPGRCSRRSSCSGWPSPPATCSIRRALGRGAAPLRGPGRNGRRCPRPGAPLRCSRRPCWRRAAAPPPARTRRAGATPRNRGPGGSACSPGPCRTWASDRSPRAPRRPAPGPVARGGVPGRGAGPVAPVPARTARSGGRSRPRSRWRARPTSSRAWGCRAARRRRT